MARRLIALTLGGLLAGSGVLVAGGAAHAAALTRKRPSASYY